VSPELSKALDPTIIRDYLTLAYNIIFTTAYFETNQFITRKQRRIINMNNSIKQKVMSSACQWTLYGKNHLG